MHTDNLKEWQHDHVFDQDLKRAGETRTLLIVVITAMRLCSRSIGNTREPNSRVG